MKATRVQFRPSGSGGYVIDYAVDYFPYGKVQREYRPGEAARFMSTQHERDGGSGYDNRGARFYDGDRAVFLGVDLLADAALNIHTSSYVYVWNNPISFLDPTGLHSESVDHDYGIDESGAVSLIRKTNDATDRLIAVDDAGQETDDTIEVEKGVLGQLERNCGELIAETYWGEKRGTYANTTSKSNALKVFKFASDHSNVEWQVVGSHSGKYSVGTLYEDSISPDLLKVSGFGVKEMKFTIHSHPGPSSKVTDYASGMLGDQGKASTQVSELLNSGRGYNNLPKYYIYRPSERPYQFEYTPWEKRKNDKNVNSWKGLL